MPLLNPIRCGSSDFETETCRELCLRMRSVLSNTNCANILSPGIFWETVQRHAHAPHVAVVAPFNRRKAILREVKVEKGEGFCSGDGLDLFDAGRRCDSKLDLGFGVKDTIGSTLLYEVALMKTVWEKDFYSSARFIID